MGQSDSSRRGTFCMARDTNRLQTQDAWEHAPLTTRESEQTQTDIRENPHGTACSGATMILG